MSTVHISYSTQSAHYPQIEFSKSMSQDGSTALHSLLSDWQSQGHAGTHVGGKNPGQFYREGEPVRFGGDTYTFDIGNSYAFSATGELSYYLGFGPGAGRGTPHTLHGKVEGLELGLTLGAGGKVANPFLSLNFETPITGSLAEGHGGDVHKVIWDLMNAKTDSLVDMLEDVYGINVEASLIDLGTPLVGIAGVDDGLLAA